MLKLTSKLTKSTVTTNMGSVGDELVSQTFELPENTGREPQTEETWWISPS